MNTAKTIEILREVFPEKDTWSDGQLLDLANRVIGVWDFRNGESWEGWFKRELIRYRDGY